MMRACASMRSLSHVAAAHALVQCKPPYNFEELYSLESHSITRGRAARPRGSPQRFQTLLGGRAGQGVGKA